MTTRHHGSIQELANLWIEHLGGLDPDADARAAAEEAEARQWAKLGRGTRAVAR